MLLQGPFSLHQISERQGKERKKEKVERETAMWSSWTEQVLAIQGLAQRFRSCTIAFKTDATFVLLFFNAAIIINKITCDKWALPNNFVQENQKKKIKSNLELVLCKAPSEQIAEFSSCLRERCHRLPLFYKKKNSSCHIFTRKQCLKDVNWLNRQHVYCQRVWCLRHMYARQWFLGQA